MPTQLSENPEEKVRQLLTDEWDNTNTAGYDPTITDPTNSNFLPISTNWNSGDIYPIITVTNNDPTVPGGGETGFQSVQGDGSGPNQQRFENMLVTIQAAEDTEYNSSLTAHEVCQTLSAEIDRIIIDNVNAPTDSDVCNYFPAPFTHTIAGDSTPRTHQYQATITLNWIRTP